MGAAVMPRREAQMLVGRNVHLLLTWERLTLKDLAQRTGISSSGLSRRFNGETGMEVDELRTVAEALLIEQPGDLLLPPEDFIARVRPVNHRYPDEDQPQLPIFADVVAA